MTSEIEELRRRLGKAEMEKKEVEASRARLDREVAVLKKHMNTVGKMGYKIVGFSWKMRSRGRTRP